MFDYIKGSVISAGDGSVTLENGGVGFKISASRNACERLKKESGTVTVYTRMHLNERTGEFELYGFYSAEERGMFERLTSVNGVGAKAGLAILSVTTPEKLALAIITNDTRTITKASGVGPKAAQRIVLELKDKLKNAELVPDGEGEEEIPDSSDVLKEAVSALMVLGYTQYEARTAVAKTDCTQEVETVVRDALRILMK